MRSILLVVLTVFVFAGCGAGTPSARTAYLLGCEAVAADKSLPEGVRPGPIEDTGIYLAKNGGCVALTLVAPDKSEILYTVWVKRVARTWKIERAGRTPVYPGR